MENNNNTIVRDNEETLIILKPEALEQKLVCTLLSYWETRGFNLVNCRLETPTRSQIIVHYKDVLSRISKDDGDDLIKRMTRGACLFAVYRGIDVINRSRAFLGATDPKCATVGTIRHKYGTSMQYNMCHASDSQESAKREILIWFSRRGTSPQTPSYK